MTDRERITPPVAASQPTFNLIDVDGIAAYLQRIGGEPSGLLSAKIEERVGTYAKRVATIRFDPGGNGDRGFVAITPKPDEDSELWPGRAELLEMSQGFSLDRCPPIPTPCTLARLPEPGEKMIGSLPDRLEQARGEDRLFVFTDTQGELPMLRERVEQDNGQKIYLPWTWWSDGRWRVAEPSGERLPLYGGIELQKYGISFVHEGEKAARHCQRLRDGDPQTLAAHPWGKDLDHVGHLAWCSGAADPERTDYSPLKDCEAVFIVADRDDPGENAIVRISRELSKWSVPVFAVRFPADWPTSYDLADPIPDPDIQLKDCVEMATWATWALPAPKEEKPKGRGRPPKQEYGLRKVFSRQLLVVDDPPVYLVAGRSDIRDRVQLNRIVSPFSDCRDVAALLERELPLKVEGLAYEPGLDPVCHVDGKRVANTWKPSRLQPVEGDVSPWNEFLLHLFPVASERATVERWIATLVQDLRRRMLFGILLQAGQGWGKGTLAEILRELVGESNYSQPNDSDLVSGFNGWLGQKRLVHVPEIYQGSRRTSRSAYLSMKSWVSDSTVTLNLKHIEPYKVRNWAHFLLASNSESGLLLEHDDRRWFLPELATSKWGRAKFESLRHWLATGGHEAIFYHYLHSHLELIGPGEEAPWTERKMEVLQSAFSQGEELLSKLGGLLAKTEEPKAIASTQVRAWLHEKTGGRDRPTARKQRRFFLEENKGRVFLVKVDLRIGGSRERAIFTNAAAKQIIKSGSPMADILPILVAPHELEEL